MADTTLSALLRTTLNQLIASYKVRAASGLSVLELFAMLTEVVSALLKVAETVVNDVGPDRKQAVLDAVAIFYDEVIAPIDIPFVPEIFESTLVDPAIRQFLLQATAGIIDALTPRVAAGGGVMPMPPPVPTDTNY